jgi:PKD repeat protein
MLSYCCIVIGILLTFSNCTNDDDPEAQFTASADSVQIGETVTFTNTSSNASFYQWDFGDGEDTTSKNASHAYSAVGTYTVTLGAIGNDKLSSFSKDIVVGVNGEVTIYPGVGLSEVSLDDTWSTINAKYASEDTAHYVDYDDAYGYYYHLIWYYNLGIAIYFENLDEAEIANAELPYYVLVLDPYEGYTVKGITLGSDVTKMEDAYGEPDGIINYDGGYNLYYYNELGIAFWTAEPSTRIDEIDVYSTSATSSSAVKSYKANNSAIQNLKEKLRKARQELNK